MCVKCENLLIISFMLLILCMIVEIEVLSVLVRLGLLRWCLCRSCLVESLIGVNGFLILWVM